MSAPREDEGPTGFCSTCKDNCVFEREPDEDGNPDPEGRWVSVCCGAYGWVDGDPPEYEPDDFARIPMT